MKMTHIATWLSLAIVGGVFVFVAVANHEEQFPKIYYSLDKTKPWNELAKSLDSRMSDGEYDSLRHKYFDDVIAPKVGANYSVEGTWELFKQQTDRPWQWNRRPSRGDPPKIVQLFFFFSAAYLVVAIPVWTWKNVLKPAGLIVRDDGLAGVTRVILHGRKSSRANRQVQEVKEREMANGTFHLVSFDEGGLKGSPDNRRLVCVTKSGDKLAIGGQEGPPGKMQNIESVLKAGMPCTVECEYREPAEWAKSHGHTHWVAQGFELRVI